jgi:hypothetical protein
VNRNLFFALLIYVVPQVVAGQRINVLYVGNSLTYINNLPQIVKLIAESEGVEMSYRVLAFPNYALEDHWNEGSAKREIASGKYDFVVVQQGPSSQQEGRAMLLNDGLKFAKVCAANNTQLAFFTVWPSKERFGDFAGVIKSYKLAADSTKSILCPVGQAWLKVWEREPGFVLYGEDNFHPDYSGSFLAALVIYGSLIKKADLKFMDYNKVKSNTLPKADFEILLAAAQQTLEESKDVKGQR